VTRTQRFRTWLRTRKAKAIVGVVAVLGLVRLALPWVAQTIINNRLAHMEGYAGRVLDVDISLWRGAYTLHDLMIERIDAHVPAPFVQVEEIDISLEWLALFHGKVVAELVFEHPILNFVGGSTPQTGAGTDWRNVVDDLVPITINHLAIHHGEVHYRDFSSRPVVDVVAGALEVEATGLSTVQNEAVPLPAHVSIEGRVQRRGILHAAVELDPWAQRPTFDLDLAVERLPAPELNRFMRAYADIDAEEGHFFLYSQIHSRQGHFEGYVKPMVEGLSLFRFGEGGDVLHQALDAFVQVVEDIFENHGTDRFATRVSVSGSFDAVGINAWEALIGILSNTFVRAIEHGLERPREAWAVDHSHSPVHG
jgi:hypothetical protein